MTAIESFQNSVIRPSIKSKHDLIIAYFNHHILAQQIDVNELSTIDKIRKITKNYNNDSSIKKVILGIVIGQFTDDEFKVYITNSREFNKRISQITLNRILDFI
jgi:hypothetical protein